MNIKLIKRENEGELILEGRLDTMTVEDAEAVLMQMTERFDRLILNLEHLEYVSSSGLRTLKRVYMAMTKKSGYLALKNVNKMIMEVFEMTGFAGLMNII